MGRTVTYVIAFLLGFAFSRVFPTDADYSRIPNGEIPSASPGNTTIEGQEIWLGMNQSDVRLKLRSVAVLEEDKGSMNVLAPGSASHEPIATITFGRLNTVDYITRNWGDAEGPQIEPFWNNLSGAIRHSTGDRKLAAVIWTDSVSKLGVTLDTIRIEMSGHGVTLIRKEVPAQSAQNTMTPRRIAYSVNEHLGGRNISMIANRN